MLMRKEDIGVVKAWNCPLYLLLSVFPLLFFKKACECRVRVLVRFGKCPTNIGLMNKPSAFPRLEMEFGVIA